MAMALRVSMAAEDMTLSMKRTALQKDWPNFHWAPSIRHTLWGSMVTTHSRKWAPDRLAINTGVTVGGTPFLPITVTTSPLPATSSNVTKYTI